MIRSVEGTKALPLRSLAQGLMLLLNSVQPFVEGTQHLLEGAEPLYDFILATSLPDTIANFLQDSRSFQFKNQ